LQIPTSELVTLSSVALLISTFGVVVRRSFAGWLSAYRYQSVVLGGSTAIIAYVTGIWEVYAVAVLTILIKAIVIPNVLVRVTRNVDDEFKIEANPYVSIRISVLISAFLVTLSYGITDITLAPAGVNLLVSAYLPVSMSLFFIGIFVMVSRRMAINQVVGLLIIENGLFLFSTALTNGVSLAIEVGILADILVGVVISAMLLVRMNQVFDTLDIRTLEKLKDD
jgi:hydrogenase-4 component E